MSIDAATPDDITPLTAIERLPGYADVEPPAEKVQFPPVAEAQCDH